jgi:hypothetical protein
VSIFNTEGEVKLDIKKKLAKRIKKAAEQRDWDGNLIEHLDQGIVLDDNSDNSKDPSPTKDSKFVLDKTMVISTYRSLSEHFDSPFMLDGKNQYDYDDEKEVLDVCDKLGLLDSALERDGEYDYDVRIKRGTPITECVRGDNGGWKITFDVGKGHTITTTVIVKMKYDEEKDVFLIK